jgi:hypothetical protein
MLLIHGLAHYVQNVEIQKKKSTLKSYAATTWTSTLHTKSSNPLKKKTIYSKSNAGNT